MILRVSQPRACVLSMGMTEVEEVVEVVVVVWWWWWWWVAALDGSCMGSETAHKDIRGQPPSSPHPTTFGPGGMLGFQCVS